jgi:hypothetical protein
MQPMTLGSQSRRAGRGSGRDRREGVRARGLGAGAEQMEVPKLGGLPSSAGRIAVLRGPHGATFRIELGV